MGHSTDKPDTSVSIKASAGIIESYDVDEHMQASEPWEVIHRQMSPGKFHARMDFLQVNGIIMYRERWSHLTMVTGATPEGYFLFGGPSLPGNNIDWCGGDINSQCLAYAPTSTEVDFMIPDGSDHWVLLVPNELLLQHLDEESQATLLSHSHHMECSQESANVLIGLIQHLINKYPPNCELLNEERICKAIEAQLLEAVTQLLRPTSTLIRCKSPTKRRLAFRRAIEYAESLKQPITVPEFAMAVGVSPRVLEMAFQETLSNTPLQYLRRRRLNFVHQELLNAEPGSFSVTEVATRWGFSELGRFAVEYRQLFGESPSTTLNAFRRPLSKSLLDSLL